MASAMDGFIPGQHFHQKFSLMFPLTKRCQRTLLHIHRHKGETHCTVRGCDMQLILLVTPFVLHNLFWEEVADWNWKHPDRPSRIDPTTLIIPVDFYQLLRTKGKDLVDIVELDKLGNNFLDLSRETFQDFTVGSPGMSLFHRKNVNGWAVKQLIIWHEEKLEGSICSSIPCLEKFSLMFPLTKRCQRTLLHISQTQRPTSSAPSNTQRRLLTVQVATVGRRDFKFTIPRTVTSMNRRTKVRARCGMRRPGSSATENSRFQDVQRPCTTHLRRYWGV